MRRIKRNDNSANKCRCERASIDSRRGRTINNKFPIKSAGTMAAVMNLQKFTPARAPANRRRNTLAYTSHLSKAQRSGERIIDFKWNRVFKHSDNPANIKITYPIQY